MERLIAFEVIAEPGERFVCALSRVGGTTLIVQVAGVGWCGWLAEPGNEIVCVHRDDLSIDHSGAVLYWEGDVVPFAEGLDWEAERERRAQYRAALLGDV